LTFSQTDKPETSQCSDLAVRNILVLQRSLFSVRQNKDLTMYKVSGTCVTWTSSQNSCHSGGTSEIVEHRSHDSRAIMMADRHTGLTRRESCPLIPWQGTREAGARDRSPV